MIFLDCQQMNRFYSRLLPALASNCVEYQGCRIKDGYGLAWTDSGLQLAHRVAYFLATGVDPGELEVCHTCDNPPCCNIKHLFLGTQLDNMQDCAQKGRRDYSWIQSGESCPNHKLTEGEVREIRFKHFMGIPQVELAVEYNTAYSNICMIVNYRTWRHI